MFTSFLIRLIKVFPFCISTLADPILFTAWRSSPGRSTEVLFTCNFAPFVTVPKIVLLSCYNIFERFVQFLLMLGWSLYISRHYHGTDVEIVKWVIIEAVVNLLYQASVVNVRNETSRLSLVKMLFYELFLTFKNVFFLFLFLSLFLLFKVWSWLCKGFLNRLIQSFMLHLREWLLLLFLFFFKKLLSLRNLSFILFNKLIRGFGFLRLLNFRLFFSKVFTWLCFRLKLLLFGLV